MNLHSQTNDQLERILIRCRNKIMKLEDLADLREEAFTQYLKRIKKIASPSIGVIPCELLEKIDQELEFAYLGKLIFLKESRAEFGLIIDLMVEIEAEKLRRNIGLHSPSFNKNREILGHLQQIKYLFRKR